MGGESLLRNLGSFDRDVTDKAERRILRDSEQNATTHPVTASFSIHEFLLPSSSFTYGASASRLPSRHGGREPVSMPRRRRSGVRTLTKRGPAAFLAPSWQIPLARLALCQHPASAGDRFKRGKHQFGHNRGQPNRLEHLYSLRERTWRVLRLVFFIKRDWIRILFASRRRSGRESTTDCQFWSTDRNRLVRAGTSC